MFKTAAAVILFLIAGFCSASDNVILIDKDCVTLQDIFPGLAINDDVLCGFDYGQEKTINTSMSSYIINKYGIKGVQPGEATFKRRGTLLTEDRLRKDLKDRLSVMYPDIDIEINTIRMGRDFYVPDDMQYNMDIPQNRFGNISVTLDNGVRRYSYSVSLVAYRNLYMTTVPVKKGDSLTGKATMTRFDMSRIHGEPVTDLSGYIARINIPAGRPLVTSVLDRKPDAVKDSDVTITYTSGGLEINASGKLMEDAYLGESVRVQNSESGTMLRGVYKGNKTVLIR